MRPQMLALGLATCFTLDVGAAAIAATPSSFDRAFLVAQAMVPPTGMGPEDKAMAAQDMAEAERMRHRFPQPVRVGDLIGLPLLDNNARTLGYVREVVRTPQNKVDLIVSYGGVFGWGARLVAVPIEVVGIEGRQIASLDMPPGEYAKAPTWRAEGDAAIPDDATILIALARN